MEAHNNNPQQNFPNAPGVIANWHFYSAVRNDCNDIGADDQSKYASRAARRLLLKELMSLARVRCMACSGYGHNGRMCPTHIKLSNI